MLAPAKLNLYLHVIGRRADGFHLLDSLVAFADVGDELAVESARGLELAIIGPFGKALAAQPPADNLVWRAAELLAHETERTPAALITLVKNLPVASGIGGGSSDAATALMLLAALWGVEIMPGRLVALGAKLGADVPVCLARRTTFIGGVGELIAPAPSLPETHVVLVNPGQPLPTPDVYKSRQGPFGQVARFADAPADAVALAAVLRQRRNDLTEAAQSLVPAIGDVLNALADCDGALLSRMSGSGATCFALFADAASARAAAARLRADHAEWWVAAGRLLV